LTGPARDPEIACTGVLLMRLSLWALAILLCVSHQAAAQTGAVDDSVSYCRQLADLYRRFVLPPAGWGADLEATFALEACRKGNPEGIPILEKKLRESRISLPGREFKP
jgi:hypothetical protein